MASDRVERRLAAILTADMVGYSRLMEVDETGTITRQRAHRSELIDPTIETFKERIVKTTGDGILVEFASVVDAVRCAINILNAILDQTVQTEMNPVNRCPRASEANLPPRLRPSTAPSPSNGVTRAVMFP